jgi:hypothetical protein
MWAIRVALHYPTKFRLGRISSRQHLVRGEGSVTWLGGGRGCGMGELRDPGGPRGLRSWQRAAVASPGRGGEGRTASARIGGPPDEEGRVRCRLFIVILVRLRTNTYM